jgi:phosphoribosylformimino-5-aminoimidazole carboxamide ribotide isomerase
MLIPSIDLKGGQVVQLVQGRDLALASDDVFAWVRKFERYPKVQLIDLDGALESGANDFLVRRICKHLRARVGGGVRSVERAQTVLSAGATHVIVSSSLFRDGTIDLDFAKRLADTVGEDRVIGAVDSFAGKVVIRGWRESTSMTAVDAVKALEPYCSEFLYTHVDTEGLMRGIDMSAVEAVRKATTRALTAAGGITTKQEIMALQALQIDAVVGMAIYTGTLSLDDPDLQPPPATV